MGCILTNREAQIWYVKQKQSRRCKAYWMTVKFTSTVTKVTGLVKVFQVTQVTPLTLPVDCPVSCCLKFCMVSHQYSSNYRVVLPACLCALVPMQVCLICKMSQPRYSINYISNWYMAHWKRQVTTVYWCMHARKATHAFSTYAPCVYPHKTCIETYAHT